MATEEAAWLGTDANPSQAASSAYSAEVGVRRSRAIAPVGRVFLLLLDL